MASISQYDKDGKITNVITTDHQPTLDLNKVGLWVDGEGRPETHYVSDGVLMERPTQETTLDGSTLTNLPTPCQIVINDETYDCEDGHADLEFDLPGTYRITVKAWPYLDAEFTYEN